MALVHGKKLNASDKLNALARENDRAASEYSWIMPNVSDDWGRYKCSQRRILADAYEFRFGVTEIMVADWLALFEKYELMKTYTVDGVLWAEWTNWQGQAASQRAYHHAPEPPWSSHRHSGRCRLRGGARTSSGEDEVEDSPTPIRQKPADPGTPKPRILADPPIHSEPVVPADPVDPVETDPASQPAREAPVDEAQVLRREIAAELAREHRLSGRGQDELLFEASSTGGGASITNLAGCTRIAWLRTTLEKLRAIRLRREAAERPPARAAPPPPSARAQARHHQANSMIAGGLKGAGHGVDRGNQPAGGDLAGPGSDTGDVGRARPQLPRGPRTSDA